MKKKRKSVIPRKPDGKIDWKAYDRYLVRKSMERHGMDFIYRGDEIIIRITRGGGSKGGPHVRRQKKLEGV